MEFTVHFLLDRRYSISWRTYGDWLQIGAARINLTDWPKLSDARRSDLVADIATAHDANLPPAFVAASEALLDAVTHAPAYALCRDPLGVNPETRALVALLDGAEVDPAAWTLRVGNVTHALPPIDELQMNQLWIEELV